MNDQEWANNSLRIALQNIQDVATKPLRARIEQLEAEVAALRHNLERSMANHVADLNAVPQKGTE